MSASIVTTVKNMMLRWKSYALIGTVGFLKKDSIAGRGLIHRSSLHLVGLRSQKTKTFTVFTEALIVGPGDLLATSTGGSIPLDLAGSLVVESATVVDRDLVSS